jgi:hypothetical protein
MKQFLLAIAFIWSSFNAPAQPSTKVNPTFSLAEQVAIKKILGTDYIPIFSTKGELAIATKSSINKVKVLANGGFSKLPIQNSTNIIIPDYAQANRYIGSLEIMDALQSKLGKERFQQLSSILSKQ